MGRDPNKSCDFAESENKLRRDDQKSKLAI